MFLVTFQRLDMIDFRNIAEVRMRPIEKGFNLIYGQNGSGKTSLLEAIYYLSRGRSFRTSFANRIVRHGVSKFILFGEISSATQPACFSIGIERYAQGETNIRLGGAAIDSIATLAKLIPLQVINHVSFNLFESPEHRRKFLDWGAFYHYPDFYRAWKQFDRTLRQRNAALRANCSMTELESWSQELVEAALLVNHFRQDYVRLLLPFIRAQIEVLLTDKELNELTISYYPGWDANEDYKLRLAQGTEHDRRLGYTQTGPHRADFKILINNRSIKDILSRGQQKLLICGMIIAQGALLQKGIQKVPIYLIDDLASELDAVSRSKLIGLFSSQEAQFFITSVEKESLCPLLTNTPSKMFHVEHGGVQEP